jgi:hypothetical protein
MSTPLSRFVQPTTMNPLTQRKVFGQMLVLRGQRQEKEVKLDAMGSISRAFGMHPQNRLRITFC